MPDEVVVDLGHPNPQPLMRPMSNADATKLASAQTDAQATDALDSTRQQQVRTALTAFMANPAPTAAETVAALKAVIRALARDLS